MAVRFISKGKGRKRKSFPIKPKKRGVSVRSVSLQPSSVAKVNKEQIKLLNRGVPATFSKALNQVIIRAKRDGIPIYDTHVNSNDRRKPYHMWIVKHPEKGDKIKGSDTIVMAEHYGQAIDDMITIWNKEERKNMTIGYPQVQGTAEKSFRFKREGERKARIISHEEADELSKKLKQKNGISNDDYVKLVEYKKSKASDLYKLYLSKFPNSHIAQDNVRWGTGIGSHGHFGDALFEGRYEDAMFRADSDNLRKLKAVGIEHFLSKEKPHPDDPSPFDVFEGRYNWAKDFKGE